MGIYRGAGGSGDAVNDASSEALITIQARDAALAAQVAAEAAQTAAELAETNAETAETNAETAETNAETAATNAASSASAASTSASNAATSATNAANSATAAQTAETNAETAETNAAASASAASTSASNAATSATNASNSASAASTSATNASNSASAAATSATNAANSATAAQTARTAAELAETNAETAETNAETAETNAAASASAAATSASNASTSASNAATSATNASNSASAAATSATNASNSASAASTSATNASNSASAAATSATNAAASYDSFDDRYLGAKSSAPTLDNDGNALLTGALYFNTTTNEMKVWSGSAWLNAYASLSGALLASNNLSDLNNTATARDNLGVEIGVDVQAYDAQLADIAGLTPSDNNFIVGNGTNFVTESGSTARTSLGLGSIATQDANNVAVTGGSINGTTVGASTPSTGSFTSLTDSGNLTFTGTGNRITGDFSNATIANRLLFQTSTTNGNTNVQAMPNGTSNTTWFKAYNGTDPDNAGMAEFGITASETRLTSNRTGTGTYLPLTMYTGGSERLRIDTSGNVGIGTSTMYGKLNLNTSSASLVEQLTLNNPDVNGAGSKISFRQGANEFGTITSKFVSSAWQLDLGTNSFDPTITLKSGNVGIGTSSPSYPLNVAGSSNSVYRQVAIRNTSNGSGAYSILNIGNDTSATALDIGVLSSTNTSYGGVNSGIIQTNNGNMMFGTAGAHATQFITSGLERMRIDSSGNVGIGISSPAFKLQVIGTSQLSLSGAGTQQALQLNNSDTTAGTQAVKLGFSSAGVTKASINAAVYGNDYMTFNVGSDTERMRIDSSGSVGINAATNLRGQLEVRKASLSAFTGTSLGNIVVSDSAATADYFIPIDFAVIPTTGTPPIARIAAQRTGSGSYLYFGTSSNYVSGITNSAMVIDYVGNVGIGTSSPSSRLHVTAPSGSVFTQISSGTNDMYLGYDSVSGMQTVQSDTGLYFATGASFTERMRITSGGNVGIGTSSPSGELHVGSTTAGIGDTDVYIQSPSTDRPRLRLWSGTTDKLELSVGSTAEINAVSSIPMTFFTNNTERMRITSGGDLQFNSGYGSVATAYGCRAWVNFNGTGTVAIRGSGNVSSITDNGVGNYTVNFTNAMPDVNYAPVTASQWARVICSVGTLNTNNAQIRTWDEGGAANFDADPILVAVFR